MGEEPPPGPRSTKDRPGRLLSQRFLLFRKQVVLAQTLPPPGGGTSAGLRGIWVIGTGAVPLARGEGALDAADPRDVRVAPQQGALGQNVPRDEGETPRWLCVTAVTSSGYLTTVLLSPLLCAPPADPLPRTSRWA